jgi:hypothetical protein
VLSDATLSKANSAYGAKLLSRNEALKQGGAKMITKGDLLVTSQNDKTVKEYNGITGAFVGIVASGGALGDPLGVAIGLDGNLLVSDGQTNQVKRYASATGTFTDVFASTNLSGPMGMTIHNGVLYVTPCMGGCPRWR